MTTAKGGRPKGGTGRTAEYGVCQKCPKTVMLTLSGRIRQHKDRPGGKPCAGGGLPPWVDPMIALRVRQYDEVLMQETRENMRDLGCDEDTVTYQLEMMKDEGYFDITG